MIEGGHVGEDAAHLGGGENDRQFELRRGAGEGDLGGPGTLEGFLPKEFDRAERLGGALAGELFDGLEVEEVLAELLGTELLGRTLKMFAELADTGPVSLLGARLEREEAEVVGEAVQDCVRRGLFLCMTLFVLVILWNVRGGPNAVRTPTRVTGAAMQ
jgi:hypothetical protein